MPLLLDLFLTFLKIGAVSFGGGYAMIPVISDEVLAHSWLTEAEILNFIAVAESTPGPVAINMATFIGASQGGFFGAVLATLGVVLPAFIIILIVASLISGLLKYAGVEAFLKGVRPVVVALIVSTGILMTINCILAVSIIGNPVWFDWRALVIFLAIAVIHFIFKKIKKKAPSPIILILISALLGMLLYGVLGAI